MSCRPLAESLAGKLRFIIAAGLADLRCVSEQLPAEHHFDSRHYMAGPERPLSPPRVACTYAMALAYGGPCATPTCPKTRLTSTMKFIREHNARRNSDSVTKDNRPKVYARRMASMRHTGRRGQLSVALHYLACSPNPLQTPRLCISRASVVSPRCNELTVLLSIVSRMVQSNLPLEPLPVRPASRV